MARLKPGQTIEAATAALRGVHREIRDAAPWASSARGRWTREDWRTYVGDGFTLVPGATGPSKLRLQYQRPLLALLIVGGIVVLIACANIANLLLAQAAARRFEMHVRLALGATPWNLVRQLLTESALLAMSGAVLALVVTQWASRLLVRQISTQPTPVFLDLSLDWRIVAFTIALTVATTLLFGTVPARRAGRTGAADGLRQQGRGLVGARVGPAGALVVAQIALSLMLVVAAGLFVGTFSSLATRPLGFDRDRVLMVTVGTERAAITPEQRPLVFERTVAAVRALPGVAEAALSFLTPVGGLTFLRPVDVPRGALPPPQGDRMSALNLVSPGWFATLGMQMRAGRDFTTRDSASATPVVVVNETFARRFLSGVNPIGQTITIGIVGPTAGAAEVVGIVGDSITRSLREPVPPTMYAPLAQMRTMAQPLAQPRMALPWLVLNVRAQDGVAPQSLTRSVTATVGGVNPDLTVTVRPLSDQVHAALTQERIVATLSGGFGALALALAGVGLFGLTAYAVSRRRAEIALRMVLGATPARAARLVLASVLRLMVAGVTLGLIISIWASRFAASLLYGLEPRDPATLIGAAVLLAGVGAVAGWVPAWRVARTEPAQALRDGV